MANNNFKAFDLEFKHVYPELKTKPLLWGVTPLLPPQGQKGAMLYF